MRPAPSEGAGLQVVILAGGEATRFPEKLRSDAGGVPLLARVYRNVAPIAPVTISAKPGFSPSAFALPAGTSVVADRWPQRGPLGGLVAAFEALACRRVFVVAGDAPLVDRAVFERLDAAWEPLLEAVVPLRADGGIEPLCAIYDRAAFLREARPVFDHGSGAVRTVVERLQARRLRFACDRIFASVNVPADRRAFFP